MEREMSLQGAEIHSVQEHLCQLTSGMEMVENRVKHMIGENSERLDQCLREVVTQVRTETESMVAGVLVKLAGQSGEEPIAAINRAKEEAKLDMQVHCNSVWQRIQQLMARQHEMLEEEAKKVPGIHGILGAQEAKLNLLANQLDNLGKQWQQGEGDRQALGKGQEEMTSCMGLLLERLEGLEKNVSETVSPLAALLGQMRELREQVGKLQIPANSCTPSLTALPPLPPPSTQQAALSVEPTWTLQRSMQHVPLPAKPTPVPVTEHTPLPTGMDVGVREEATAEQGGLSSGLGGQPMAYPSGRAAHAFLTASMASEEASAHAFLAASMASEEASEPARVLPGGFLQQLPASPAPDMGPVMPTVGYFFGNPRMGGGRSARDPPCWRWRKLIDHPLNGDKRVIVPDDDGKPAAALGCNEPRAAAI
jgi:hypothetical protein